MTALMPPATTDRVQDSHPLISIWLHPRATIRHIVETNPMWWVWALFVVAAFLNGMDRASRRNMGDNTALSMLLFFAILLAPLAIPLSIIGARIARWAGAQLGGVATTEEVRAALAWGGAPAILANLVLWPLQLALFGREMFTSKTPLIDNASPVLLLVVFGLPMVVMGWSVVTLVKVYAEVHRFSVWRALGSAAIVLLAVFIPMLILTVLMEIFVPRPRLV